MIYNTFNITLTFLSCVEKQQKLLYMYYTDFHANGRNTKNSISRHHIEMQYNRKELEKLLKCACISYLIYLIGKEYGYFIKKVFLDVAKYNGENCDHLKGTEMDVYTDYESTARTVLRLMWFLDYVAVLLEKLIIKPNDSLGSICAEAYSIALAPHHPFAVRFAARTGMLVVGRYLSIQTFSRESLFKIIF